MSNEYLKSIIIIQRLWQVPSVMKPDCKDVESATVGYLTFYKKAKQDSWVPVYSCYTIENGGESSSQKDRDARIMPGEYTIAITTTRVPLPREYTGMGGLLVSPNDPDFIHRRIFIHAGNYPQDTRGCILLQSTYDTTENPGFGRGSMRACKRFYDLLGTGTNSRLVIRDEANDGLLKSLN